MIIHHGSPAPPSRGQARTQHRRDDPLLSLGRGQSRSEGVQVALQPAPEDFASGRWRLARTTAPNPRCEWVLMPPDEGTEERAISYEDKDSANGQRALVGISMISRPEEGFAENLRRRFAVHALP